MVADFPTAYGKIGVRRDAAQVIDKPLGGEVEPTLEVVSFHRGLLCANRFAGDDISARNYQEYQRC